MDIDKIILKCINKKTSIEEYAHLDSWKKESEDNLEFLKQMMLDKDNPQIDYKGFDKEAAWNEVEQKIEKSSGSFFKYLLGVIISALLVFLGIQFLGKGPQLLHESNDKVENIILADNSNIWLNKGSNLKVDQAYASARKVALQGEAFFEVEAEKSNPFIIDINGDDFIKVIGTSFNVVNTDDNFDLTVYSGTVELHSLNRVLILNKNDRVTKVNGSLVKIKNKEKNILSWKDETLIFEDADLSTVFKDLSRHFKVDINIEEKLNTSNCALRSRFVDQDIENVMSELKSIWNLEYTQEGNTFTITNLNCD